MTSRLTLGEYHVAGNPLHAVKLVNPWYEPTYLRFNLVLVEEQVLFGLHDLKKSTTGRCVLKHCIHVHIHRHRQISHALPARLSLVTVAGVPSNDDCHLSPMHLDSVTREWI